MIAALPPLSEYESADVDIDETTARRLAATGYVTVSPAPVSGWRVTAKNHVGSLVVDDVEGDPIIGPGAMRLGVG